MNRSLLLITLSLALGLSVMAQEDPSRQIIPEEFTKARPSKSTASTAPGRARYRNATAKKESLASTEKYQQLGLTIWRLRPTKQTDTGTRIIVQETDNTVIEWTPERMAANAPLKQGEKLRFTFESPQPGFLYVIDREQYADGSTGDPVLIFPTKHTRGGDNQVAPGRLIEIPGQEDRPNYFTLKQSRADQVSELLTVIVSAQPLEGIVIGEKPLKLAPALVAQWEKEWSANTETFELTGGVGRAWTKAEQEAGADVSRQLTQDDPGPQTVYRVAVKAGAPLLVRVGLKYVGKKSRKLRKG